MAMCYVACGTSTMKARLCCCYPSLHYRLPSYYPYIYAHTLSYLWVWQRPYVYRLLGLIFTLLTVFSAFYDIVIYCPRTIARCTAFFIGHKKITECLRQV